MFYDTLGESSTGFFNVNHGNELRTMEFFENGKPDHEFTVAETSGQIAALAFLWDIHTSIPWFGIAVHDTYQKRGLGSVLLQRILNQCRQKGYGGLLLRTSEKNCPAQKLYEKHGFERIGMHPSGEILYLKRFLGNNL